MFEGRGPFGKKGVRLEKKGRCDRTLRTLPFNSSMIWKLNLDRVQTRF